MKSGVGMHHRSAQPCSEQGLCDASPRCVTISSLQARNSCLEFFRKHGALGLDLVATAWPGILGPSSAHSG